LALIKHLLAVVPETLERESSEGWTPLQVAVRLQRVDVVSYLISQRDNAGHNMLHAMLTTLSLAARTDVIKLKAMIQLFDKDALKEMSFERCKLNSGALTPLALWMAYNKGKYKKPDIVETLAEYSTGEDLGIINGEGDLPLHVVCHHFTSSILS